MKQLLFTVFSLIAFVNFSQSVLYFENFESPTHSFTLNTTNMSGSSTANLWLVNNSYAGGSGSIICLGFPFSFTIPNTTAQPSGINNNPTSKYMHICSQAAVASGITSANYTAADGICTSEEYNFSKMSSSINTIGKSGVTLNFWWLCGGEANTNYGEVYYSTNNGASWTLQQSNFNNSTSWVQASLNNPLWDNQSNLLFAFRFVNLTASAPVDPGFSVDDILVTGNCNTTNTINVVACNSYTSPSGNHVWTNSNTYKDTIPNNAGCDSIITINLTINTINTTTSLNGLTITSNQAGAIYKWLDCNNQMQPIAGATSQSYTAQINGNYAVMVTKNGCIDTSSCVSIISVGIIKNSIADKFTISPNPTSGKFAVEFANEQNSIQVKLFSITGQMMMTRTIHNSSSMSLEINEEKGIYLLEISDENGESAIIRLIKE